ncbi:Cation/H(+) antiporter 17 [Acorus calamus]|uniref:Cation/H(+) antiporter 17 n=1 Tax=Acorus calamus TaxID=4465 RepID=A0AAV9FCU5_ACOCL|nr:Cation/H(+) antiporter 17 [Acorus calamus]
MAATTTTTTAGDNRSFSSIIVFDDMTFLCHHVSKVTNASFWNGNPLHSSFSLLVFQICMMFFSSRTVRFLLKPLKQSRLVTDVINRFSDSDPE